MIKLKAKTKEDLKVIASLIQDAILPIGDFAYIKQENKVMFALNRYCWEVNDKKQRSNSVFSILNANAMQTKNIDITDRKQKLSLLDICFENGYIIIIFSDNKKLRISVSDIEISLVDVDDPWGVEETPNHY
ncbi:MAG: DUF2948 family protein [Alphaproteobacteria bacterium]|nr:DUF2948 family protein [Alphaproteobacteria bacterium]